jgi:hypothetical protein
VAAAGLLLAGACTSVAPAVVAWLGCRAGVSRGTATTRSHPEERIAGACYANPARVIREITSDDATGWRP